jgi:hypothetical protein
MEASDSFSMVATKSVWYYPALIDSHITQLQSILQYSRSLLTFTVSFSLLFLAHVWPYLIRQSFSLHITILQHSMMAGRAVDFFKSLVTSASALAQLMIAQVGVLFRSLFQTRFLVTAAAIPSSGTFTPQEVVKGSRIYMTRYENPFGGSSPQARAFFLDRGGDGNVLMYSPIHIQEVFEFMESHGGLRLQVVNHRDEVGPSINKVRERFDAPFGAHHLEKSAIEGKGVTVDKLLFEEERNDSSPPNLQEKNPKESDADAQQLFDDLWAVHTPGHTQGATCFLYLNRHDGKRYLFTGDSIYTPRSDELGYALMIHPYKDNVANFKASLARIRSLKPDVIIPSLSQCDQFAVSVEPTMFDPLEAGLEANHLSI